MNDGGTLLMFIQALKAVISTWVMMQLSINFLHVGGYDKKDRQINRHKNREIGRKIVTQTEKHKTTWRGYRERQTDRQKNIKHTWQHTER